MNKQLWVVFFLGVLLLSGCFPTQVSQPTTTTTPKSQQDKAELFVEQHVLKQFSTLGEYKPYRFGQLYVLKPLEIEERDNLLDLKTKLPSLKDHYGAKLDSVIAANDSAIARKQRYIKANRIHVTYEISHVFKVSNAQSGKRTLYEYLFYLLPNGKVKNVSQVMEVDLTSKEDDWFYYYIMQYPLFNLNDKEAEQKLNAKIYTHFNAALTNESGDKGDLLKAILGIVAHIKEKGNMDPNHLGKASVAKWMSSNKSEIRGYKSLAYSKAKQINVKTTDAYALQLEVNRYKALMKDSANADSTIKQYIQKIEVLEHEINQEPDSLAGFKLFHAYQQKEGVNETVEKAFYFEMDLFFRIKNVLHVDPPFEQYFEE
jgi:hypothetical protein